MSNARENVDKLNGLQVPLPNKAALKAIDVTFLPSGYAAQTLGYANIGDGGGGLFRWAAGNVASLVASDQAEGLLVTPNSAPTGSSGAWVRDTSPLPFSEFLAEMFGIFRSAFDDESKATLNAARINYWRATMEARYEGVGRLVFGQGTYFHDPIAPFTTAISLRGAGNLATAVTPSSAFTATDDGMIWRPSGQTQNVQIKGIYFGDRSNGLSKARRPIYFDTSVVGAGLVNLIIEDCGIAVSTRASSKGLRVYNASANNLNGGYYLSQMRDINIGGGLELISVGDSNVYNHIQASRAPDYNIKYSSVDTVGGGYASQAIFSDINTTYAGAFQATGGGYVGVINGNCEQFDPLSADYAAGAPPNDYMFDFNGTASTLLYKPYLRDTLAIAGVGCDLLAVVRCDYCQSFEIDGCNILLADGGAAAAADIVIGSNATDTYVGRRNSYNRVGGAIITDNGIGTRGLKKALSLSNSWVAYNSEGLWIKKSYEGDLLLRGTIKDGTVSDTTIIATTANGFRPPVETRIKVVVDNAGTKSLQWAKWKANGEVSIDGAWPGSTCVEFDTTIEANKGAATDYV